MKWSIKDMLLILGIVVAAIIIASAIIHKDQLPLNSSVNKTILSKKIAFSPLSVLSKTKKAAVCTQEAVKL